MCLHFRVLIDGSKLSHKIPTNLRTEVQVQIWEYWKNFLHQVFPLEGKNQLPVKHEEQNSQ